MCRHCGEVFGELLVSLLTKPMIQSQSPVASSWIYVSVFCGTNQGEFNDGSCEHIQNTELVIALSRRSGVW